MTILRRAVADRWPGLLGWAGGLVGLILFTVALYPSIKGNPDFDRLVEGLPVAMRSLFSIDNAIPLTSPAGYLQVRLFGSLLPLILLVFAIGAGARAIAGTEESGMLELILMNPVTRVRVALERYASLVAMVLGLAATATVALLALAPPFGALRGVSIVGATAACAAAGLLALLHGSVAFVVGAITGRRVAAVGAATTLAIVGYLIHGFAPLTHVLDPFEIATPWHWYAGRNMLRDGIAPDAFLVPLAISALMVGPAVRAFARRDLH